MPRRSAHNCMIGPMRSDGTMKLTFAIGSRNSSMMPRSGTSCGLSISDDLAVPFQQFVGDVGSGLDQIDVRFFFQPLLDDLHVQHAQESAAEAEAEGVAGFGLKREAGVVEAHLLQLFPQLFKVGGIRSDTCRRTPSAAAADNPAAVAPRGLSGVGDRVADVDAAEFFDAGDDVTDLSRAESIAG